MRRFTPLFARAALGAALLFGGSGAVFAETTGVICPVCKKAGNTQAGYPSKAGHTLVRGTANTLLGWTELIRQPANEVKEGGNVFVGLGKGVGETLKRTFGGIGEVLTFWTPKMKNGYVHFSNDCPICMGKR